MEAGGGAAAGRQRSDGGRPRKTGEAGEGALPGSPAGHLPAPAHAPHRHTHTAPRTHTHTRARTQQQQAVRLLVLPLLLLERPVDALADFPRLLLRLPLLQAQLLPGSLQRRRLVQRLLPRRRLPPAAGAAGAAGLGQRRPLGGRPVTAAVLQQQRRPVRLPAGLTAGPKRGAEGLRLRGGVRLRRRFGLRGGAGAGDGAAGVAEEPRAQAVAEPHGSVPPPGTGSGAAGLASTLSAGPTRRGGGAAEPLTAPLGHLAFSSPGGGNGSSAPIT